MQTHKVMKIIVGVTGASGTIYARRLLERLIPSSAVSEIALIVTDNGKAVAEYEGEAFPESDKIRIADNHSMFDATASGSADYDAMVVIPCSMGTLGRIASGVSTDLMCRAADVMLKERRRLILCTRETPLSLIHIKNMERVTLAGGIILPASPSFYSRPASLEELCDTVVERVIAHAGVDAPHFQWIGK